MVPKKNKKNITTIYLEASLKFNTQYPTALSICCDHALPILYHYINSPEPKAEIPALYTMSSRLQYSSSGITTQLPVGTPTSNEHQNVVNIITQHQ